MNTLRIAIPGLLAALALAGCDDTETLTTAVADLCVEYGTVCEDTGGVSCDPTDGVCKCGGHGGVVCGADMACTLDPAVNPPSATCVSERCAGVVCDPFEACDAADGLCKCDGQVCGDGRTCLAGGCSEEDPCAGVVCFENHVCDPSDRTCKCGGMICSVGESCQHNDRGVGYCVGRNCVGKNCADGTVCNPVDGLCHCGSAEGDVCTAGQTCAMEDEKSVCVGPNACEGVVCAGHTVCSPIDGRCHCGGYIATAPVCGGDQICDLDQSPPRCVGGRLCADVVCESGSNLSCDGETGECRCGGTGGLACDPEQGCIDASGRPACVTRCDPTGPDVCGGDTKGCYLSPADGLAYCADAGTLAADSSCQNTLDCVANHHCVQTGTSVHGICRRYCDTSDKTSCFDWDVHRTCMALAGAPDKLGVCVTVQ